MILLQQMLILFFYMMIGYWAKKKGFFGAEASSTISWIVVNIANPAMIISSVINGESSITGKELINTAILACISYAVLLVLAEILPRIFKTNGKTRAAYKIMTVFNNIGFMGFPVISAAYGPDALLYAAIFVLPYNILFYTYGITVTTSGEGKTKINLKQILNIGSVASILAVVLYVAQIPMHDMIKTPMASLSGLTSSLSMFVIGISLSNMKIRELFTDFKLVGYTAIKLLVIPVIGTVIASNFIHNQMLLNVFMIMLATPAGAMTAMLAQEYDGDYELASKAVALTTVLSVITIPIVSAIVF